MKDSCNIVLQESFLSRAYDHFFLMHVHSKNRMKRPAEGGLQTFVASCQFIFSA